MVLALLVLVMVLLFIGALAGFCLALILVALVGFSSLHEDREVDSQW